jgi:hypothetical protein
VWWSLNSSDNGSWRTEYVSIEPGPHTVRWTLRTGANSRYEDSAFVDWVRVEGGEVLMLDIPSVTPEGTVSFTVSDTPGTSFNILVSDSFTGWDYLGSDTLPPSGTTTFTDTQVPLGPQRFYLAEPGTPE